MTQGNLSCAIHLKYLQLGGEELDAIENLSCKSTLSVLTMQNLIDISWSVTAQLNTMGIKNTFTITSQKTSETKLYI